MRVLSRTRSGGGQIATAIAVCARFGLRVRYVGRVGDDEEGRFMRQLLEQDGIDLSCLQTIPGRSSQTAFILVDLAGERTILWSRDPGLLYRPGEIQREWIQAGRLLHLDSHGQAGAIEAAGLAREVGMKVSLDIDKIQPGVEELLGMVDYVIPTLSFVRVFTGLDDSERAMLELDRALPGVLAATDGSRGSLVVWEGQVYRVPGFQVEPIDTTGAGDVFHGAFVYALLQNWSVARILRFANAAGAIATTRLGARGGVPTLTDVEALLRPGFPGPPPVHKSVKN